MKEEKGENKKFPDLYEFHEKEGKRIGEKLVHRNIQPDDVLDVKRCPHKFIMKGLNSIECEHCHWGLFVKNVKEAEDLIKKLNV